MSNKFIIKTLSNSLKPYEIINIDFIDNKHKDREGANIYFKHDDLILRHYFLNPLEIGKDLKSVLDHMINNYEILINNGDKPIFHPVDSLKLSRFIKPQIHADRIFLSQGWSFEREEEFMELFRELHSSENSYRSILKEMISYYRKYFPEFFTYDLN